MSGRINRRGLAALLLCLAMMFTMCACTKETDSLDRVLQKKCLVFGIAPDSCPVAFEEYSEEEDAGAQGLAVDVAKALASGLNVEAQFVFVEPEDAVEALGSGMIDCYAGLAGLGIKETAQLATVDSGMDCRQVVAVASDSDITRLVELYGRTVCAVSGSDAAGKLAEASMLKSELGVYYQCDTIDEIIEALDEHSCDAIVVDEPQLLYATRFKHECVIISEHIASSDYVLAFRLRDTTLCERIALLYDNMQQDGTLDAIKKEWLG